MSKGIQISDHFFLLVFPKASENLKSLDIGRQEVGAKRRLNGVNKRRRKKLIFFCCGNLRSFFSKNVQIWDHLFPLLFTKDFESLKNVDIQLWEVGATRRFNGTSEVNKWKIILKKHFSPQRFKTMFWAKMFKSETTSCHYFSPKDSESLKILDFGKWGTKTFKRYLKSEQTDRRTHGHIDRHTDTQADIPTYRKHRPRGHFHPLNFLERLPFTKSQKVT